ncbi:hypothetical protein P7C73_g6605, partial [Tremellales sp. Uapishka_1]
MSTDSIVCLNMEGSPVLLANIGVENTPLPKGKRKVDDGGSGHLNCSIGIELTSSVAVLELQKVKCKVDGKKAKTEALAGPLVELKGRKLVFRQEPLPRNLPRRRLLNFEGFLLDAEEAGEKITQIPEEYWDLIVMAGHELSSSSESLFIKHLKTALESSKGSSDPLSAEILSPLVQKLFTLRQFGFMASDYAPASSTKIPAALQIRSWEANDIDAYFPEDQREIVKSRRQEREAARLECLKMLERMDDVEKLELFKGDKGDKGDKEKVKVEEKERTKMPEVSNSIAIPLIEQSSPTVDMPRGSREGTANTAGSSRRSMSPTKKGKMTPEEEDAARLRKQEREAKKIALAEKKAAKELEEKRKAARIEQQKATMSSFFVKPKAPSPVSRESPAGPSSLQVRMKPKQSVPEMSDFKRMFRRSEQRANFDWAAPNRWYAPTSGAQEANATVISGRDLEEWGADGAPRVASWEKMDFVEDHLTRHGLKRTRPRSNVPRGLKTAPFAGSVQEVWLAHQEAIDPRKELDKLKNRRKFPWKTLAFDQQARPPYSGTFTKKSLVVGPRTPFAQDPIFDYSYDSGDEWQDDEGGEDVDDIDRPKSDEEVEDEDEEEGEFDDWLDDSDDMVVDEDGDVPMAMEQARLPMKVVKKTEKVSKRVVKVTPYWKGPVWEDEIGHGTEGLETYRIQLLNETPASVDPFTYVSTEPAMEFKTTFSDTVIGINIGVKCLLSAEPNGVKEVSAATADLQVPAAE